MKKNFFLVVCMMLLSVGGMVSCEGTLISKENKAMKKKCDLLYAENGPYLDANYKEGDTLLLRINKDTLSTYIVVWSKHDYFMIGTKNPMIDNILYEGITQTVAFRKLGSSSNSIKIYLSMQFMGDSIDQYAAVDWDYSYISRKEKENVGYTIPEYDKETERFIMDEYDDYFGTHNWCLLRKNEGVVRMGNAYGDSLIVVQKKPYIK